MFRAGIWRALDATALRQPDFVTPLSHINEGAASAADGNVIGTQRDPEPRRTAEQALEDLGFSWDRLEKLARTALHDHMTRRRIHLDDDRYQRCLDEFFVETGARWAIEYDPALAGGRSFASSCYRRMYPRLIDFLRHEHGDQRRGQPLYQVPTKYLPDRPLLDDGDFDEETAALASKLPARARWTLEQIGRPIAEQDMPLHQAAANAGITAAHAEQLLDELGHLLGRTPAEEQAADEFALMEAWAAA